MGLLTSVSAAVRTRHGRFSGTSARPWIIVNQSGVDLLNTPMLSSGTVGRVQRGESLYYYQPLPGEGRLSGTDDQIDHQDLYVRLATTSSDQWEPELAIVWATAKSKGVVPLAIETDMPYRLSTNLREGSVSAPVRRVRPGDDDTTIERLLLVVVTYDAPYAGTDDPISLRLTTRDDMLVDYVISDTPQTDLEIDTANTYEIPTELPFRRGQLKQGGNAQIKLTIHGRDKWVPKKLFLFGLDHPTQRPTTVVPLAKIRDPGPLSADPAEGVPSIILPVL
ncbi:MAG: hypothetical protein PVJ43_14075 [Gemmatimonadales bacterium]|jgi:hypothetical protein